MILPDRWFVEPVTIEPFAGQGAYGDEYGDAVTVLGHVAGSRVSAAGRRVQSSAFADEVVTNLRVLLPNPARLADGTGTVDPVALLTPESRVTSGTVSGTVSRVEPHIQPGTGAVVYVSGELG